MAGNRLDGEFRSARILPNCEHEKAGATFPRGSRRSPAGYDIEGFYITSNTYTTPFAGGDPGAKQRTHLRSLRPVSGVGKEDGSVLGCVMVEPKKETQDKVGHLFFVLPANPRPYYLLSSEAWTTRC